MSAQDPPRGPVFLYRLARATAAQLQALVPRILGGQGWTFGGASIWDAQGPDAQNLRPIEPLPADSAPDVAGDFGHAFNPRAEVRWKRIGQDAYDVLVLAETDLAPQGLTRLESHWRSDPDHHIVALQHQPQGQPPKPPLWGTYYYGPDLERGDGPGAAPSHSVVFVRYTHVKEREP